MNGRESPWRRTAPNSTCVPEPAFAPAAWDWFSLALGVASLAAPRLLARAIGVPNRGAAPAVLRAVGVREIACGLGLLSRPRPAGWTWARVAGDVMDLALLTSALGLAPRGPVGSLDGHGGGRRSDGAGRARRPSASAPGRCDGGLAPDPRRVRKVVTVNRRAEEVYRFWRDFAEPAHAS